MLSNKIKPASIELTNTQRDAAHWQWVIASCTVVFMLLLALFEDGLLQMIQPLAPLNTRQLRMLCNITPSALACLALGFLSVRYQVTIVARRLDIWRPTGGRSAVIHGWVCVGIGLSILALLGFEIGPLVQFTTGTLLVCGGAIFALAMLGLILRGLRRAFSD